MEFEQVYHRFVTLSGLNPTVAASWQWLCNDAMCKIQRQLNDKAATSDCDRLSAAAGVLAYYMFTLLNTDENVSSFKAGDVSIGFNGNSSAAEKIWQLSRESIEDLLDDNDFIFKQVKS